MSSYKKDTTRPARTPTIGVPKPRRFSSAPSVAPLRTRVYSKQALSQDPVKFTDAGFGDTGLAETPSILGMGKSR